jgi:hypothetical protein
MKRLQETNGSFWEPLMSSHLCKPNAAKRMTAVRDHNFWLPSLLPSTFSVAVAGGTATVHAYHACRFTSHQSLHFNAMAYPSRSSPWCVMLKESKSTRSRRLDQSPQAHNKHVGDTKHPPQPIIGRTGTKWVRQGSKGGIWGIGREKEPKSHHGQGLDAI